MFCFKIHLEVKFNIIRIKHKSYMKLFQLKINSESNFKFFTEMTFCDHVQHTN